MLTEVFKVNCLKGFENIIALFMTWRMSTSENSVPLMKCLSGLYVSDKSLKIFTDLERFPCGLLLRPCS